MEKVFSLQFIYILKVFQYIRKQKRNAYFKPSLQDKILDEAIFFGYLIYAQVMGNGKAFKEDLLEGIFFCF